MTGQDASEIDRLRAELAAAVPVVEAARALLAECDDLEGEYDAVGIGTIRHFLAARAYTDAERAEIASECCDGTGYADYAAVPCPNPACPVPIGGSDE